MDVNDLLKDPDKLKKVLRRAIWNNDKKLAEILIPIVRDPRLTYLYAFEIVQDKIKDEWEDIISKDAECAYRYAFYILKGPFPKGEDAISKVSDYSYYYAEEILKGPFPKGEDAISRNDKLSYMYAKFILEDRFKKGEGTIIKDKYYLEDYIEFLKQIGKLDEFLKDHPEVKLED
jgi:hypothetical protein